MVTPGGRGGTPRHSRFPVLVSVVCALGAAALLVTTTLPALGENAELRRREEHHRSLLERLATENDDLRQRTWAVDRDPQALLMEIDRAGRMPGELPPPTELPSSERAGGTAGAVGR